MLLFYDLQTVASTDTIPRMDTAPLTPEEFDAHLENGTMRLSFVGMSNGGKSYRSRVLANEGDFLWYQVDGDIQKELGFKDQDEISAWLGHPTSPTYREREQIYLNLENKFTSRAAMSAHGKNLVFDTTGSVVHLSSETHNALRDNTLVVHLDVGDDSLDEMLERFFKEPKPLAWSSFFSKTDTESEDEALRRSYPILLAERLRRYRNLAHINLPAKDFRHRSGADTLALIRRALISASIAAPLAV